MNMMSSKIAHPAVVAAGTPVAMDALPNPDAELLALCAELPRMEAIVVECRVKTNGFPQKKWDTEPFVSLRKQREAAEKEVEATITEIFTTPAQSQAGYAVKADLYFSSADRLIGFAGCHGEFATSLNGMAHALLKDLRPQLISSQCRDNDAELIQLCAEIDRLEDEWLALGSKPGMTNADAQAAEDKQDSQRGFCTDRQYPLIDKILEMRATTLDGLQARARTIVKWAPNLFTVKAGPGTPFNPAATGDELMVAALLRDLIGEARA
jgi:hypothetical protein